MRELPYRRADAVSYAQRWAFGRNPAYYDFSALGGDCTNFVSQCLFAGSGVMNNTPTVGWYYRSLSARSASWTGVRFLHRFLTENKGVGPYGHAVTKREAQAGDVVFLLRADGTLYHSMLITARTPTLLVTSHTFDAKDRPLSSYAYGAVLFLHIDGVRNW